MATKEAKSLASVYALCADGEVRVFRFSAKDQREIKWGYVKVGHFISVSGKAWFDPEQELWIFDRNSTGGNAKYIPEWPENEETN